jgi:hypothetical protein
MMNRQRSLNHQYFELLKSKVESGKLEVNTDSQSSTQSVKKITIKEVQEKVKIFLLNARVFDKAIKSFPGKITNQLINY